MRELSFNLGGDSGEENTDNALACLDFFNTVKYQKKTISTVVVWTLLVTKHQAAAFAQGILPLKYPQAS